MDGRERPQFRNGLRFERRLEGRAQQVHGAGAGAADDDMIRLQGLDEDARGIAQHLAGLPEQVQERRIARPRLRDDRRPWRPRWA